LTPGETTQVPVGSKGLVHIDVSKVHIGVQRNVPPAKPIPSDAQLCPPSALPSHASPASRRPLPHGVHRVVSNTHPGVHASVPPPKPWDAHVAPPRSAPSHCSVPSRLRLPQVLHPEVSHPLQSALHVAVPDTNPSAVQSRVERAQHVKPSSQLPLQLSSAPLHTSAGGAQLAIAPTHTVVPRLPQGVVHATPATQHISSTMPSQSSSIMLPQDSVAAGVTSPAQTVPHLRSGPHTWVPGRQRPTVIVAGGPV